MIKKIDANKYGVVKYAITSVDELKRLPKKIAPSSQAILIENGLRVFVYGDGQWVEEVVDGDLSENMQSIVADYERSKIGYDGVKRGSLEERLKDDFQGIYDILNARDYCEYSGKELKVDNTWMGNQIDTKIEGRTLQNLCVDYADKEGDTFTLKDKVTMLGSDTDYQSETYRIRRLKFAYDLKPNTTYTFIINIHSLETQNNTLSNYIVDGDGIVNYSFIAPQGVGVHIKKFTTNDSGAKKIALYVKPEETSATISSPIVLEGDYTQTPLSELPYFEGIESVGEREIGKNLFDGVLEVGSYDVNGTPAGGVYAVRSKNYIEIDPNKQYCISLKEYSSYFYIHCYDKDKKNIGEVSTKSSFKPLEGCKYITFNTYNGVTTDLNSPIQLEEGTQATEYEPFGYKIKGKSCGKNLFDVNLCETPSINGLSFNRDNSELFVTGTSSAIYDIYVTSDNNKTLKLKKYINNLPIGTTLRLSNNLGLRNFFGFINESGNISYTLSPYTTKSNEKEIMCFVRIESGQNFDNTQIKIQLEESTTTTPYEPYQESTYSIHSPIPLRSLPNGVCDIYDFESGAVIQRVGKVVLDGSEDWVEYEPYDDDVTKWFRVDELIKTNNRFLSCISDKFICVMSSTHTLTGVGEVLSISPTGNGRLNLRINKDKLSSLDVNGFKLWLQANPTTVYYELEEPIIHYLTPSQLKSFDGTTHVVSENTLVPTTTTKILTNTYANVSNVNSTAYSLRRGVNDVAETSAIINETDVEQDDVLDVTMCAIDELYSMLEPNLE